MAGPNIQCILDSSPDPRENSDVDTTNIQSAFRRGLPLSDLEDKIEKNTQSEYQKEKVIKQNEDNLKDLWYNMRHNSMCITRIPEGKERELGIRNLFEEIMTKRPGSTESPK